jgi:hypothetical protein
MSNTPQYFSLNQTIDTMNKMKQSAIFIVLIINILCAFSLKAQENKKTYARTISISQFIKELQDTTKASVNIRNTNIEDDPLTDKIYTYGAENDGRKLNWDSILQTYPKITIHREVNLLDIRIGPRTILPNITFKKSVHIERFDVFNDLSFRGCIFDDVFYCVNTSAYFFRFMNCQFNSFFNLESIGAEEIFIEDCTMKQGINVYQNDEPLNMSFGNNVVNGRSFFQSVKGGGRLLIYGSTFTSKRRDRSITIGSLGSLDRLSLIQDTFLMPLNLAGSIVKDNFLVNKCSFTNRNAFANINLPEGNTYARWGLFKNEKLGVAIDDSTYYNASSPIATETEDEYFALIKVYSQFLRAYKNNGDQESYNACYIEMKDIQTRKAAFNFQKEPTFNNYFDWKLNRFLKIFCDYGTNPVKALIMSFWVIVTFGFLYFIFPSEGTAFQPKLFWQALKNYKSRKLQFKNQAKTGSKQILNAMALSMNAFVTLGYGDMPARGIARYLAVFEGLTGWFLLSIFSSSLISQILQ